MCVFRKSFPRLGLISSQSPLASVVPAPARAESEFNLVRTRKLSGVLQKILMRRPVEAAELRALSHVERVILDVFLDKKKLAKGTLQRLSRGDFSLELTHRTKRFEENIKFVFQRMSRFLLVLFKRELFPKLRHWMRAEYSRLEHNKQVDYAFHAYYFEDVARQISTPIEKFFQPKPKLRAKNAREKLIPKTISRHYFHLVKISQVFTRDARLYLGHVIQTQMEPLIRSKLLSLCEKWDFEIRMKGDEAFEKQFRKRMKNDVKCKLPWTKFEMESAISEMNQIFH